VPREAEHRALPDARRAGFVFAAAQNFVRESLSAVAWNDLARLSSGLPDWSLVFSGEVWDPPVSDAAEGVSSESSPLSPTDAPVLRSENEDRVVEAVTNSLSAESWLALETPAGTDDNIAGLRAAIETARKGQRVLLAVPDAFAWNALRKSARDAASTSPRVAALAEPSGYLCRTRLRAITENPARVPPGERAALLPLVAWADRHASGPVADGRGFSPERARVTWSRVSCDTWDDDPSARTAREAAASAGVILVTHAALCAHVALEGALLPACDSVIVTGAHRFPDAAQSPAGAGRAVSLFRLGDDSSL
jgi:hypothetical protein